MTDLKHTALHDWHIQKGAKMVPFAGYDMPVQYPDGLIKEHHQTRSAAGLFDVSHMGQIQVEGDNIAEVLETVFPANILGLDEGKQVYSLLMNSDGGVIDDLMICRREFDFLIVVNAACKHKDMDYLNSVIGDKLNLTLLNDRSLLALQGPKAADVLTGLGADVDGMFFMDARWIEVGGVECWATRSGYTGEDGFELSVANDRVVRLADMLCASDLVSPIGLGARDTLRLEAGLCLYGHELNEQITPIEASLIWSIAKPRRKGGDREGGFLGDHVIFDQMEHGVDRKRIGLVSQGKAPVREGTLLFTESGEQAGEVCSGSPGPTIGKPIAMAYIDASITDVVLYAEVRGKRLPMDVTKMPFVPQNYFRG